MALSLPLLNEDTIKAIKDCYDDLGESERALNAIKDCYDDLGESERALNFTHFVHSLIMSENDADVTVAIDMINEHLESNGHIDPLEKVELWYPLAVGYFRKGNLEKCSDYLELIFEVAPNNMKAKVLAKIVESSPVSTLLSSSQIALAASAGGIAAAVMFTNLVKMPGWLKKLALENPALHTAADVSEFVEAALKDSSLYGVGVAALLAVAIAIQLRQHYGSSSS